MEFKEKAPVIRIIGDSACDWTDHDTSLGVEYASAPLIVATNERSFRDDDKLKLDEMLDYLAAYHGRSFTACPNTTEWLQCYEGADIIYVVTLSSHLSGSYNAAMTAAEEYKESHPDAQIHVFDSRTAGPQMRLWGEKIAECVKAGMSFDEVVSTVDAYWHNTRIFFALESFHNFAQNGRVNKAAAMAAGLLGIRMMATGSSEGVIETQKKCRGVNGTLKEFKACLERVEYAGGKVRIGHCKNAEVAGQLADQIRADFPDADIDIYQMRGLCSFYAERGGVLMAIECNQPY